MHAPMLGVVFLSFFFYILACLPVFLKLVSKFKAITRALYADLMAISVRGHTVTHVLECKQGECVWLCTVP